MAEISWEEFERVEIRVGTILEVEAVPVAAAQSPSPGLRPPSPGGRGYA